jgi:hypothetical protein
MTRHGGNAAASAGLAALLALAGCSGDHATGPNQNQVGAPEIASLDVTPSAFVEPGGTIVVHYHVTSTAPLRRLRFFRSGANTGSDSIGGRGSTDVTDSIAFLVTTTASVGQSIVVRMEAEDTLHRTGTRTATGVPVRDTTPPGILVQLGPNYYPSLDSLRFSIQDTINITINANDNATLRWVGYRFAGAIVAAESTTITSTPATATYRVPLRATSVGTSSLAVFARDASGNQRTVTGHVDVYPAVNHPMEKLTLGAQLAQFLYDPKRHVLFAARADNVHALEMFTLSPIASLGQLSLPAPAGRMDLSASGDSLFVVLPSTGSLAVIDLTTRQLRSTIALLPSALTNRIAGDVAVAANGKAFVGLNPMDAPGGGVLEINLTTGAQQLRTDRPPSPARLAVSGDRQRIGVVSYPDCAQPYDAATDKFGACVYLPPAGGELTADLHGTTFLWGPTLLDASLMPVRQLTAPRFYSPVSQVSADGTMAFFATGYLAPYGQGFVTVHTSDGRIIEQQLLPVAPELLYVLPDNSAVVAQGRICQQLSPSSYSCGPMADVYVIYES